MTTAKQLKNPPIIEAILDIDCDLAAPLDFKKVETRARKELAKSYPKVTPQFLQEHQFEAKIDEPPKVSVRSGVIGLQFLKNDGKQVLQFRAQGFSFNRLAPYTSLDDYLAQIKRAWLIYAKLASPVQIKLIRLRYINRLLLPFDRDRIDLDEYLRNGPRLSDPEALALVGFLNQYVALDKKSGHQVNSVLTLQPAEGDKLPVIFDNGVAAIETRIPEDWTWIRSKILELRELKNKNFWDTLTEKCLNLF